MLQYATTFGGTLESKLIVYLRTVSQMLLLGARNVLRRGSLAFSSSYVMGMPFHGFLGAMDHFGAE